MANKQTDAGENITFFTKVIILDSTASEQTTLLTKSLLSYLNPVSNLQLFSLKHIED